MGGRASLPDAAVGVENERGVGVLGLDGGDDALRVRLRKLGVLLRRQVVGPAVKELHHLNVQTSHLTTITTGSNDVNTRVDIKFLR